MAKCSPTCTCGRHQQSDESKRRKSEALRGRVITEETRKKISEAKRGVPLSEDHRAKLSEIHLGKPKSQQMKDRLSQSRKGLRDGNRPAVGRYLDSDGYVILTMQYNHPMTTTAGTVRENRMVLYDTIGPGPHSCWVCGITIDWDTLHADHVNGVRHDNRPENLRPSCGPCNRKRRA